MFAQTTSTVKVQGVDGNAIAVTVATLNWTPTAGENVANDITVMVQDGRGMRTLVHYTVYLQGGNNPPAIAPVGAISGTEGQALAVPLSVSDADGNPVTTTIRNLPPGATYDAVNNQINWTPAYTQAGAYNVTVVATDGSATATQTFTLTIAQGFANPVLNPVPAQTLSEDTAFGLQLAGSMPGGLTQADGSTITLQYSAPLLPYGATLDPNTGWLSWTPTYDQAGVITVPVTLTATYTPPDGSTPATIATTAVTQTLTFNVLATPVAPQFAPVQTYYTQEGQPLQLSVFAFDPANPDYQPAQLDTTGSPDAGAIGTPSVSYEVSGLPPGATFDPNTAMISWTPDATQAGTYSVTITATSNGAGAGVALSSTTTLPIVVEPVIAPPVIAPIANTSVAQGDTLSIPVSATDASGNPVTLTVSALPAFASFTQTSTGPNATGTLTFAPGTYERGDYTITVTASDNGGGNPSQIQTSAATFVLSATSLTEPPQLLAPQQVVAVVGQPLSVPLTGTDLDQDTLTFSAQGLPPGAQIVPGTQYGQATLEWTPPAGTALGTYNVSLTVTDAGMPPANTVLPTDFVPVPTTVAADLAIVLKAGNTPPQILQVQANGQPVADEAGIPGATLVNTAEGQPTSVTLLAYDPDGDYLNWTAGSLPPGMSITQTETNNGQAQLTLNWTPGLLAAQSSTPGNPNGSYSVALTASDGMAHVSQTVQFQVAHVAQPPVFQPLPTQIVNEGSPLAFSLSASDPDGTTPTLNLVQDAATPAGVSFNPATGAFAWTPPANLVTAFGATSQTFNFTFSASNGNQTVYQTVVVQVVHVDQAPQIACSSHALIVGQSFSLTVVKGGNAAAASTSDTLVVGDIDGAAQTQALTVAFSNLPAGATYNAQTGTLNWTPGPGQTGSYQVTATVTDSFGSTSTQTFTLRVAATAAANAPTILIDTTPSMAVQPGASVLATVRATAFASIATIAVATSTDNGHTWNPVQLNGAGQFSITPVTPGIVLVQVTATDADGNSATQTGSILVADPHADAAPTLAWGGGLTGNGSNGSNSSTALPPMIITQPSLLQAQIADDQLMGWQLQMAPAGSNGANQWTTVASGQDSATNATGLVDLTTIDPSTLANGVYTLRLTAQNLIGGVSEIDSRIEIDSSAKNLTQAAATDAVLQLGSHSLALTRTLPTAANGMAGTGNSSSNDFGNWQLPILSTQLTSDQPATDSDGSTAAWRTGAQVWLQMPSALGVANAPTQYLHFTLGADSQPVSNAPGAPRIVTPAFNASNGWTLVALHADANGNPEAGPVNLQMAGNRLYNEVTGQPWQPAAYVLTGPDGAQYTLTASGQITRIQFTDGQQWLVSDAGIALAGNNPAARIVFARNTAGQIDSVSDTQNPSAAQTVLYEYDAQGRLELARTLDATGLGAVYGYHSDGSLITPPNGGSIAASLGEPADWITGGPNAAAAAANANAWSGSLSSTPVNLSYVIGDSEIASTVKVQGATGSVILAVQTQGVNVKLNAAGATVLSTSTQGNLTTTLISVTTAGMKLLSLTGTGSATVTLSVAGDLNHDGTVNGNDAALLAQDIASGSLSGDIIGNGQPSDADTEVLDANYGFAAALPPQAIAQSGPAITTHTGLSGSVALSSIAQDDAGNPLFWRILSVANGAASLSADGQSLIFTPAPGYSGPATVTLQADDGFTASAPITVNINVSSAPLLSLNVTRLPTMTLGTTGTLQITGAFADETHVALTGSYVQIQSSNPAVVSVDANGILHASSGGIATLTVSAGGIAAENVITAGSAPATPATDANGNELDVYPLSIDLPAGAGQRQIDVHALTTDGSLGTDLSAAATGTQYFISDPSVATISADGLIQAKAGGTATITVINGGWQGTLQLQVQAAVAGPTTATVANGAVTTDANGDTLMIGAGALSADTTASITALNLSDLDMPLPAPTLLNALGAVTVNLGGQQTSEPLQLAVHVGNSLAVGTQVMFWQEGAINDANGVSHQTWWLMDNGVIGTDGLAHTASQPYSGITSSGNIVITATKLTNNQTGAYTVTQSMLDWNALWSQQASIAMGMNPDMAADAIAIFATTADPAAVSHTIYGSYQLQLPPGALSPSNIGLSFPAVPTGSASDPDITGLSYNPASRTLTVTGNNFIPAGQSPNNFQLEVWLEPRGQQLSQPTVTGAAPDRGLIWQGFPVSAQADGSLQITLPAGVALSQHDIYVERTAIAPMDGNAVSAVSLPADSNPVEAWTPGTTDTIVTTRNAINLYAPRTSGAAGSAGLSLVTQLTTDEKGNPLTLAGSYTTQIAFSDDGTLAYVAGAGDKIYVVDLETQEVVYTLTLQNPNGSISALAVNNGWLYIAQNGSGGGLARVNIDQTSANFMQLQQNLNLGLSPDATDAGGFDGLAVNDGSYLAITASAAQNSVSIDNGAPAGNVYMLDLNQIQDDGSVSFTATVKVTSSAYPRPDEGKNPTYVVSGDTAGQFLVSNTLDYNGGLAGLSLNTGISGQIDGSTTVTAQSTLLIPSAPNWVNQFFQEDIQRAAGVVVFYYQGQQYALVADNNFVFNDVHFDADNDYGVDNQIGGKIGVVQNPFGQNGQPPVYLGATTPMPGSAISQLSLSPDGTLYGSVWNYNDGPGFDITSSSTQSLLTWNAGQLVQLALDAQAAGKSNALPIDRISASAPQIDAPALYDDVGGAEADQPFNWIYGVATYSPPGGLTQLAQQQISYPTITVTPPQTPVVATTNASMLGLTPEAVDANIAAGNTGVTSAAWYAAKTVFYDGWNFVTAGFVGRQDARLTANANGKLSDGNFFTATAMDAVTSIVSMAAAGEAGGLAGTAAGGGYLGAAAGGAAAGAGFDIIQQTGQLGIYSATGGQAGKKSVSFTELATSTALGAGLGLLGEVMSNYGTYKIQWNSPGEVDPLQFRVVAPEPSVAAAANDLLGTSADSTGSGVDVEGGETLNTPDGQTVSLPDAESMDTADATQWLITEEAQIPKLVDASASLQTQAYEAVDLENAMTTVAREAMDNPDAAGQLNITDPVFNEQQFMQKVATEKHLSGEPLYKEMITEAANDASNFVQKNLYCFVAGTLVHTKEGLVPIEKITAGDWVLSQPEQTGELAYKQIEETFVNDNAEVWLVEYRMTDIPLESRKKFDYEAWGEEEWFTEEENRTYSTGYFVATGNHPVWLKGVGWTRVDRLSEYPYGPSVMLNKDGKSVVVINSHIIRKSAQENMGFTFDTHIGCFGHFVDLRDGNVIVRKLNEDKDEDIDLFERSRIFFNTPLTRRVYNFRVADFSTYYVGEEGIWVHNTNSQDAARLKGMDVGDAWASTIEGYVGVHPSNGIPIFEYDTVFATGKGLPGENRGLIYVTERPSGNAEADVYGQATPGASTLQDGTPVVPAVRYDNPNSGGYDVVKFDDFSVLPDGKIQLIDKKLRLVGSDSGINQLKNWRVALKQNNATALAEGKPGFSDKVEIQVPDEARAKLAQKILDKNGLNDVATIVVVPKGVTPSATSALVADANPLSQVIPESDSFFDDIPEDQNVVAEGMSLVASSISSTSFSSLLSSAKQYWLSAGAPTALLQNISISMGNLPLGIAAQTLGNQITLSANGAGWGWFVDPNPTSEAGFTATGNPNEFTAIANSPAAGKLDLLTVLIHEMGHVLGLSDVSDNNDIMAQYLTPGMRRLPSADDIAQMLAASAEQLDSTGSVASGIAQTIVNPPPVTAPQSGPYIVGTVAATLVDGDFTNGTVGWSATGNVSTDSSGNVTLANSSNADAQLAQTFDVSSADRYLEFTVANGLQQGNGSGPTDAFDVALDNASTGTSLAGTDGLTDTDGLLNIQADGSTSTASSVQTIANANGSTTYVVDLQNALDSGTITSTPATLSFDLAGFAGTQSQITLSNIALLQTPLALNESVAVNEDAAINIHPLAGDPTGSGATPTVQIVQNPAHGTLTRNADGSYAYVPDTHFFGSDSFQYSYTVDSIEGSATSNIATVNIAVSEVAYPPTGNNSSATVTAGKPYTFDPLAGANDINGNPMTAVLDTPPANGTVTVNADSTWTYTPNTSYAGPDSLTYHIADGQASSTPLTASFTVKPAHHAPVAHSSAVQVQEDGSLLINLASYGTDIDGNPMTGSVTGQPVHGMLTQNADGTFTYTPAAGYYGQDTLSFIVSDAYLSSQQASLSIEVTPVLANSSLSLNEAGSIDFNPLASQNPGAPLTASIVTQPANGKIIVNADGAWTYTPNVPFYGADSFSYAVNDGTDNSNVATVSLTVVHPAPVISNGSASLNENASANLNLTASASEVPGYTLNSQIVAQPAHGSITQNADGTWTYTPNQYFYGADSFSYKVNDGVDDSNVATVTLTVNKVEIAPTLVNSSATLNENAIAILNLLASATDVNGDPVTASIVTQPAHGTVTKNARGLWTYTPNQNFYGTDTFTYSVSDGTDSSNVATVTLTVNKVEIAPTLANSSATLNENAIAILNLLASATDVNGDPVTASIITQPAHGTVTKNARGLWTYTPNQNFFGTDTFTYSVSDGTDNSNVATVTLNVNKVEIAPTLANSSATLNENAIAILNLLASATDVNGDPVTVSIVTQPAHGTVTKNARGLWTYTPNQNFFGTDTFTYSVSDGTDNSNVATVTLNVNKVEIAPTLANSSATLNENAIAILNLLASATDVNGDPVTVSIVTQPAHGTVTKNARGLWTYTPNQNFFGTDTFTYSVSDGTDNSNVATVTLNVNKVEIAPTLANSSATLNENAIAILNLLASATDVNGDPVTASIITQPAHGTVTKNARGLWTYTPNQNFYGTDTFTYSVSDGTDSSNIATVSLTVKQLQQAPTLSNSTVTGPVNTPLILQWSNFAIANPTDPNGVLTLTISALPALGQLQNLVNGQWTAVTVGSKLTEAAINAGTLRFVPVQYGYSNPQQTYAAFGYTVSDGTLTSNAAMVSINITPVAAVPTLTLSPPATSVSQTLINTSWEGAGNNNAGNSQAGPTIVDSKQFAGWTMQPVLRGKDAAFEIWSNNQTVKDAAGAGQEWLGLTNGINSNYQAPGIQQVINTVAGAQYTFSLDYAGQPGLSSVNTQIGIYLDGSTLLGTYSNTSGSSLNWQTLNYTFKGDGNTHTLSVQLINGTNTGTARGAMIDALNLTETLPQSASTVYGFAGSPIALPQISDQLAAHDPGQLETTLIGLPAGAIISDGKNKATISNTDTMLNVTGWNLNALMLTLPQGYGHEEGDDDDNNNGCGDDNSNNDSNTSTLNLQVVATSIESNGSMASIAKDVTVQLLTGQACAMPMGANPYVSYINNTGITQTGDNTGNGQLLVCGPLTPQYPGSCVIQLPKAPTQQNIDPAQAMDAWMQSLEQAVNAAFDAQLEQLLKGKY